MKRTVMIMNFCSELVDQRTTVTDLRTMAQKIEELIDQNDKPFQDSDRGIFNEEVERYRSSL